MSNPPAECRTIYNNSFICTSLSEFMYQAVLRVLDGSVIANEALTVDVSILEGSIGGSVVFT